MKNNFSSLVLLVLLALSTTRAVGQIRRNTGLLHRDEAGGTTLVLYTEKLPIRPESRDAFLTATTTLNNLARSETGCLDLGLYESTETPGTFLLIGEWASEAALAAHKQQPYELAYQQQLPAFLAAPATATAYQVSRRTRVASPAAHR